MLSSKLKYLRYIGLALLVFLSSISLLNPQVRYTLVCRQDLLIASRSVLHSQVGVLETSPNRGSQISLYQQAVGIPAGSSYCYAGQFYCFSKAAANLHLDLSFVPIPRSGLANSALNLAVKLGYRTSYIPHIDDLITWKFSDSPFGHVERIVAVHSAGWVSVIGFNTGSKNQSDGEGVFFKKRNIFHALGRMRIRGLVGFRSSSL